MSDDKPWDEVLIDGKPTLVMKSRVHTEDVSSMLSGSLGYRHLHVPVTLSLNEYTRMVALSKLERAWHEEGVVAIVYRTRSPRPGLLGATLSRAEWNRFKRFQHHVWVELEWPGPIVCAPAVSKRSPRGFYLGMDPAQPNSAYTVEHNPSSGRLIVDDPMAVDPADTPEKREAARKWFTESWPSHLKTSPIEDVKAGIEAVRRSGVAGAEGGDMGRLDPETAEDFFKEDVETIRKQNNFPFQEHRDPHSATAEDIRRNIQRALEGAETLKVPTEEVEAEADVEAMYPICPHCGHVGHRCTCL